MYCGSCLCGAVKHEVRGAFGAGYFCHCSRCRKATGSAFASSALVATKDFVVIEGDEALKSFSVNGVHRVFCSHCGSPIISRRDAMPDAVRVRLGTLDSPLERGPQGPGAANSLADRIAVMGRRLAPLGQNTVDAVADEPDLILSLDDLISRLAAEDPTAGRIASLHLFGGLSIEEAGDASGISRVI